MVDNNARQCGAVEVKISFSDSKDPTGKQLKKLRKNYHKKTVVFRGKKKGVGISAQDFFEGEKQDEVKKVLR